ncbi:MAG TPA: DUF3160 domain-containing protein, partial [Pirellulales bacterium]|nr:DUF3160 domain-containing protein [Pirellulales bacterium]
MTFARRRQRQGLLLACAIIGAAWSLPGASLAQAPANEPAVAGASGLSFDPLTAELWETTRTGLSLSMDEAAVFAQEGLVIVDRPHPTFAHAYDFLYRQDLPLLVTSDSILYVVHASLDNTLVDLEENLLFDELGAILQGCHEELGRRLIAAGSPWVDNYRDVDLYLSVARRLLDERPAGQRSASSAKIVRQDEVAAILDKIDHRQLEHPLDARQTTLFGDRRPVDYSQFQPRGHYTRSQRLRQYFLASQWLGRADCGWFVTPASRGSGLHADVKRQLRDAVLLVELLTAAGQFERFELVSGLIGQFIGHSDNLTPASLRKLMAEVGVASLADLADPAKEQSLRQQLKASRAAEQKIASQSYLGKSTEGSAAAGEQESPPGLFQLLGQRFAIDSWVLANVVYDAVQTANERGEVRMMPRGLDVMAALGNPQALELLADDLRQWKYEPQLRQATAAVAQHLGNVQDDASLYDLWLSALCTLHDAPAEHAFFPEVMRERPWQLKQLQTQLASWSELRHASILYAKQSYTRSKECDYPAGYVEPYPDFYAGIRRLAQQTMLRLDAAAKLSGNAPQTARAREKI